MGLSTAQHTSIREFSQIDLEVSQKKTLTFGQITSDNYELTMS